MPRTGIMVFSQHLLTFPSRVYVYFFQGEKRRMRLEKMASFEGCCIVNSLTNPVGKNTFHGIL